MPDSFGELLKLLFPEIIVDYFELTFYKKGEEILHLYIKEINSIVKEYRQSKLSYKGFLMRKSYKTYQFEDIKYTFISLSEDGSMKILEKLYLEIGI